MRKRIPLDYDIEALCETKQKLTRHAFSVKKENQDKVFAIADELCEIIKRLEEISKYESHSI